VRGVASVPSAAPPEPPLPPAPGHGDEGTTDSRGLRRHLSRRLAAGVAFVAVLAVSGATAWALQAGGDDDRERTGSTGPAAVSPAPTPSPTRPSPTAATSTPTAKKPTTSTAEAPRTGREPLSVSLRISADPPSTDRACEGFGGTRVFARITTNGPATVRYVFRDESATLERGSRTFRSGGRAFVSTSVGGPLGPGESASRRVTVTISSPAGTSSKSLTVSLACTPTTEPSDETDPDTPSDPDPSQPAADG
jgi:hypothetical protein